MIVDEHLAESAVVEPARSRGVFQAATLEAERLRAAPVGQTLAYADECHSSRSALSARVSSATALNASRKHHSISCCQRYEGAISTIRMIAAATVAGRS